MRYPEKEQFDKDTANHSIDVQLDDGVFRHIVCTNNGSSVYRFNITTWPGYLCISGDMGCFVFSRLFDMFEFFVDDKRDPWGINPGYWGEKLQERGDSYKKYCSEKFEKTIRELLENHLEWEDDDEKRAKLEDEMDTFFTETDTYFEADARRAIGEFDCSAFDDVWECDFDEYTFHYIWCLRAIVWCINHYNAQKKLDDVGLAA